MRLLRTLVPALLVAATALPAHAAPVAYTPDAFTAAIQGDKPVVVEAFADWCPTCRAQRPVLDSLLNTPKYKGYTFVVVDFDQQKDALKRFKVAQQSTLIVFHGTAERGRATGVTAETDIAHLLDEGL